MNFIFGCENIENLQLEISSSNKISDKNIIQLYTALQNLKKIQFLKLKFGQFNKISDESLVNLGKALQTMCLKELVFILDGNNDVKSYGV